MFDPLSMPFEGRGLTMEEDGKPMEAPNGPVSLVDSEGLNPPGARKPSPSLPVTEKCLEPGK